MRKIHIHDDPHVSVVLLTEAARPTLRILSSGHERETAVDINAAIFVADEKFSGVVTLHDPYAHGPYRTGALAPCRSIQPIQPVGWASPELALGVVRATAIAAARGQDAQQFMERAVWMALSGAERPLPPHASGELRVELIAAGGRSVADVTVLPHDPAGELFTEDTLRINLDTRGEDGEVAADLIGKIVWCIEYMTPQLAGLRRSILSGLPLGSMIVQDLDGEPLSLGGKATRAKA